MQDKFGFIGSESFGTPEPVTDLTVNAPSPMSLQLPLTGTYTYSAQAGHVLTLCASDLRIGPRRPS